MRVRIVQLGRTSYGVIEAVQDDGRTLVVAGARYTLRRINAHFVREGEPSYGTRVVIEP
jgi:hypothetical protein